jgi:hypothetical protein
MLEALSLPVYSYVLTQCACLLPVSAPLERLPAVNIGSTFSFASMHSLRCLTAMLCIHTARKRHLAMRERVYPRVWVGDLASSLAQGAQSRHSRHRLVHTRGKNLCLVSLPSLKRFLRTRNLGVIPSCRPKQSRRR